MYVYTYSDNILQATRRKGNFQLSWEREKERERDVTLK